MSIVAAAALLAVTEGVCRLALGPEPMTSQSAIFELDDAAGFRVAGGLRLGGFSTTRLGTRGPEPDFTIRERILVLGDSMTIAVAIPEGRTFCDLLQQKLGADSQVYNAGCPGYGPAEELSALRRLAPATRPTRVLTAFFCGNDFMEAGRNGKAYYVLGGRLATVPKYDEAGRFGRWIMNLKARLWSLGIARAARRIGGTEYLDDPNRPEGGFFGMDNQAVKVLIDLEQYEQAGERGQRDVADGWARMPGYYSAMRDECTKIGASFTAIVLPLDTAFDPGLRMRLAKRWGVAPRAIDAERPSRKIVSLLKSLGIDTLDLTPEFRDSPEKEKLHLPGDLHLSEAGHALAAEGIHRHLAGR
jgi:lysophospholipase L1-like esterase